MVSFIYFLEAIFLMAVENHISNLGRDEEHAIDSIDAFAFCNQHRQKIKSTQMRRRTYALFLNSAIHSEHQLKGN